MIVDNDFLDSLRFKGDELSDKLIQTVFERNEQNTLLDILGKLKKNSDLQYIPKGYFHNYFTQITQSPNWLNQSLLNTAERFASKNLENLLSMLGFYSLPYCYAAKNGVKVLAETGRLEHDIFKRLSETAKFVLDVIDKDAFRPDGCAIVSCIKVRLMHAYVRFKLLKNGTWDTKNWGIPINQEDLAGTNLAFSLIPLRGLNKIAVNVSKQESQSFLHLWKVAGYYLGVDKEILSDDGKKIFWIDKKIAERHFETSTEGIKLTSLLLQSLKKQVTEKFHPDFTQTYMRFLLGDDIADILKIPNSNWTQNFIYLLKTQNTLKNFFPNNYKQFHKNVVKEINKATIDFLPEF